MKIFFYILILLIIFSDEEIFLSQGKEEEKFQGKTFTTEELGYLGKTLLSTPDHITNKRHGIVIICPRKDSLYYVYGYEAKRLASHGFYVMVVNNSPGDGSKVKEGLDYFKIHNGKGGLFSGKLDMNDIALIAHDDGAYEAIEAMKNDTRIKTVVLNDFEDPNQNIISSIPEGRSIAIINGINSFKGNGKINTEIDFEDEDIKSSACLIMMDADKYDNAGSAINDGFAASISWIRWHLGGEDYRKADFVGTSGKYINGPIIGGEGVWQGKCKNF